MQNFPTQQHVQQQPQQVNGNRVFIQPQHVVTTSPQRLVVAQQQQQSQQSPPKNLLQPKLEEIESPQNTPVSKVQQKFSIGLFLIFLKTFFILLFYYDKKF